MAERVPAEAYNQPLTSFEAPRRLGRLPGQDTIVNAFNHGYALLEQTGQNLETRVRNREFSEFTVEETATYLDYQRVRFGRRNLNAANLVAQLKQAEAQGQGLTSLQRNIRVLYQEGNFHLIPALDYPLSTHLTESRYVIPVRDGDSNFAIFDGAPVDGIIREIDRRICQLATHAPSSLAERLHRFTDLRSLRHARDILFTQSTPIYHENTKITHARNQYETKLKNEDPLLSELQDLDWYKSEKGLLGRRVTNFARGRNRWGCLPLVLPLISLALLPTLCNPVTPVPAPTETPIPTATTGFTPLPERTPVPTATPEPQPTPKPVTIIKTNPCEGISEGQLRFEVFTAPGFGKEQPSARGHNQREAAYQWLELNQREYRTNDDSQILGTLAELEAIDPVLADAYLTLALADETRTAQRIRGDQEQNPFLPGTDFDNDFAVLASCTTPEQRMEKAIDITGIH